MTYNLTALTDADTFGKMFLFANEAANSMLGGLFVLALFFILMMGTANKYGFINAALFSSFACFLISGVMWFIPAVNIVFPLLFLAILAFTFFYSVTTGN